MKVDLGDGRTVEFEENSAEAFVDALIDQAPDVVPRFFNQETMSAMKNATNPGGRAMYQAFLNASPRLGLLTPEGIVPNPDATGAMSPAHVGAVAAGDTMMGLVTGAQKLVSGAERDAELEEDYAERQRLMTPLRRRFPTATTVGGAIPYFTIPGGVGTGAARAAGAGLTRLAPRVGGRVADILARIAPAGSRTRDMADAVLTGAAVGALDESTTALEEAGASAVGTGIANTLLKGRGSRVRALDPEHYERVQDLRRQGFALSPKEATRGRGQSAIDFFLGKMPFSELGKERMSRKNQKVLKRLIREEFGLPSNFKLDDHSDFQAAATRILEDSPRIFNENLPVSDEAFESIANIVENVTDSDDLSVRIASDILDPYYNVSGNSIGSFGETMNELTEAIAQAKKAGGGRQNPVSDRISKIRSVLIGEYSRQFGEEAADHLARTAYRKEMAKMFSDPSTFLVGKGPNLKIDPRRMLKGSGKEATARTSDFRNTLKDLRSFEESFRGPTIPGDLGSLPLRVAELGSGALALKDPALGIPAILGGTVAGLGRFSGPGERAAMEGPIGAILQAATRGSTDPMREILAPYIGSRTAMGISNNE